MKVAIVLAYHGANFVGWQYQHQQRSVEAELTRAVSLYLESQAKRCGLELSPAVTFSASGRTDAGVHAKAQVASFEWPSVLSFERGEFLRVVNHMLGADLAITDAQLVATHFNARKTPHTKCYRYYLSNQLVESPLLADRSWNIPAPLAVDFMNEAAHALLGKHDFSMLCSAAHNSASTIRVIESCRVFNSGDGLLVVEVIARGFLKNMIRIIVGVLVEVGKGRVSQADFLDIRDAQAAPPKFCFRAPAKGLCLEWVRYLGEFESLVRCDSRVK